MDDLKKLLSLPRPPRASVLSCCRELGCVPPSYRGLVLACLLNVHPEQTLRRLEDSYEPPPAPEDTAAKDPQTNVSKNKKARQALSWIGGKGSETKKDTTPLSPPPPNVTLGEDEAKQEASTVPPTEIYVQTSRLSIDDFDEGDEDGDGDGYGDSDKTEVPPHVLSTPPPGHSTGGEGEGSVYTRSPLQTSPTPLPNQRVIKADAERTRGDPKTVERLLTHFCHFSDVKYKQGLNELLAPFLTLNYSSLTNDEFNAHEESHGVDDKEKTAYQELMAYGCFEEFLKKFLPTNVYSDDGFASLQCCFRLYRLLLLYHDPNLCKLLDGHKFPPELYASGWFLTLFSQRLEMDVLWKWWDLYVLYDEPHLHHFVCLKLLTRGSDKINQSRDAEVPIVLQQLSLAVDSIDPVKFLQEARMLADETPRSFISLLDRACWGGNYINEKVKRFEKQSLKLVLKCCGGWSCVPISADEAIGFALKEWGIVEPDSCDGRTPPRFRHRSRGSSAESREKLLKGSIISKEHSESEPSPAAPPAPFQDLPSYLTSPDSTASATSLEEDTDLDTDFESEIETDFSDEEGSGGEENDVSGPTSPAKVKSSNFLEPLSPLTPNSVRHSKIIHQRKNSKKKYVLLDCRPKSEYDECHVFGSMHLDEECWNTGEVTSVIQGFSEMKDCHFALIGSGPHSFDLQMSVNAHKTGPSKYWKRKQRLKNASGDAVQKTEGLLKKMAAAMSRGQNDGAKDGFALRRSMDDDEGLDPEHMQVGASEEDIAVSRWVCMFLQHDFAHISYVRGGIKAIVKTLSRAGREGGVGLAEGAEACLEGEKVGVGGTEETLTYSAREFGNMIKNLGKDGKEEKEGVVGKNEEAEGGGAKRPPRRSLEGVGKGWSKFVSNVKTKMERRTSKDKFEEPLGSSNISADKVETTPQGSPASSPPTSPKGGARGLARMFGLSGPNKEEHADTSSPSPRRASELNQISASLDTPPSPNQNWVRKLSVGVVTMNNALSSGAQSLAAQTESLARKGKAMVPRSPRGSEMVIDTRDDLRVGSIVSQAVFVEGGGLSFPAMQLALGSPGKVMVGSGRLMFMDGSADTGMVSMCIGLDRLSKITTRMTADGVSSVLCVVFKAELEGIGEDEEVQFVVEGHRECVEAVKGEFKRVRGKKKTKMEGFAASTEVSKLVQNEVSREPTTEEVRKEPSAVSTTKENEKLQK